MKGRKPNGKGKTVFKNGDVYEGEYVKGKREGYAFTLFPTVKSMTASGFKTNSTAEVSIIL